MKLARTYGAVTISLIVAIFAVSLAGAFVVLSQYDGLRVEDGAITEVTRMRNGVVAIADVVRARDALFELKRDGQVDELALHGLADATDFLFVRADTLRKGIGNNLDQSAERVVAALDDLVALLDEVLADPAAESADPAHVSKIVGEATAALMNYYDQQKGRHIEAVSRKNTLLRQLVVTTMGLILLFAVITTVSAILWRAEYLGRVHRQEAEARANTLAYYDSLTGLPNRASFLDEGARILGEADTPALILMDLDDFKIINDSYGHQIGDLVLRALAGRVSSFFHEQGGFAARLGGDEFAAVLPEALGADELQKFVDDLILKLADHVTADGLKISPRLSIGAVMPTMLTGPEAPTLQALIRAADYALYEAKSSGRFRGRIYDAKMAANIAKRREMKLEMPRALHRGEFFIEYQPQFNLVSGRLHGFEALARWRRDGTVVPPGVFIEIAEEDDFIVQLDAWVLQRAMAEAVAWNRVSPQPVKVSTNLSARNFHSADLIGRIQDMLQTTKLPADLLTLEITESVLIEDWVQTLETLSHLSKLGIKIALDDFGTGFSSLSYLRRLNVNEVKIDRAFVVDIETSDRTRMMMDALVDIAQRLGMQLTIEGIETKPQAEILADLGGEVGQGFLFSWPVTATEALDLAANGGRSTRRDQLDAEEAAAEPAI
ncbi:MAG: bifunctional diguanylate cyclase/phosphodiesterase [Pseudomonadota bacterium]